jgi:hypothetical protein
MKRSHILIALGAICAMPLSSAARAAQISISIDGQPGPTVDCYWMPAPDGGYGGKWVIGVEGDGKDEFEWESSECSVELHVTLNPDPFIAFTATAVDFGAPSAFSFSYVMPLIPLVNNPSFVLDSLSGSVTNGPDNAGVTVTALAPPAGIPVDVDGITEIQVFTLSDDNQATWKNVGLDNGPSVVIPLGPFGAGLYPALNQGPIPTIPGGPWTDMRADLNFMLSGGGDTLTLNGVKVLTPEPGTFVLALLSFGLLGFARQRY